MSRIDPFASYVFQTRDDCNLPWSIWALRRIPSRNSTESSMAETFDLQAKNGQEKTRFKRNKREITVSQKRKKKN